MATVIGLIMNSKCQQTLVNENIFRDTDLLGKAKKETVLEKTEKEELGVNNGLTVIPFNLSDDGKTLRIRDQKYVKISEDIAKTAVKNRKDCNDLKVKYTEEELAKLLSQPTQL